MALARAARAVSPGCLLVSPKKRQRPDFSSFSTTKPASTKVGFFFAIVNFPKDGSRLTNVPGLCEATGLVERASFERRRFEMITRRSIIATAVGRMAVETALPRSFRGDNRHVAG